MFQVFCIIHTKYVNTFRKCSNVYNFTCTLTHCVHRVCQQPTNIFQYYINYNVRFVNRINNTTLIQNYGEFDSSPFLEKRRNKSNEFQYVIVYGVL